jgi:hypothetical protein
MLPKKARKSTRLRNRLRRIWSDPVFSNIVANAITALVAWIFYRLTSSGASDAAKIPGKAPDIGSKPDLTPFWQTENGFALKVIILALLLLVLLYFLGKLFKALQGNTKYDASS